MRPSRRFSFIHTIKHIKDLSLELCEMVSLVFLFIDIYRGGEGVLLVNQY
jgi:hypothetical protein